MDRAGGHAGSVRGPRAPRWGLTLLRMRTPARCEGLPHHGHQLGRGCPGDLVPLAGGRRHSASRLVDAGCRLVSVTAAGVPAYEQIRKERLRARAQRAAVDAAIATRVTMNDALDPIAGQLARQIAIAGRHEREALAQAAIPMVLDSAAHWPGRAGAGLPVPVRAGHPEGAGPVLSTAAGWTTRWNRSPRERPRGTWSSA